MPLNYIIVQHFVFVSDLPTTLYFMTSFTKVIHFSPTKLFYGCLIYCFCIELVFNVMNWITVWQEIRVCVIGILSLSGRVWSPYLPTRRNTFSGKYMTKFFIFVIQISSKLIGAKYCRSFIHLRWESRVTQIGARLFLYFIFYKYLLFDLCSCRFAIIWFVNLVITKLSRFLLCVPWVTIARDKDMHACIKSVAIVSLITLPGSL